MPEHGEHNCCNCICEGAVLPQSDVRLERLESICLPLAPEEFAYAVPPGACRIAFGEGSSCPYALSGLKVRLIFQSLLI